MSSLPVHARGEGWLTGCGQDRANVRYWSDVPGAITCEACAKAAQGNA